MSGTPLAGARALFDLPRDIAYLNCAGLAPLMRAGAAAGAAALARRERAWTIAADDWFGAVERRRALFAGLAGVSAENVALVPAASYGLATAANNLRAGPGRRVLLIAGDYPSNVFTWQAFCARHGAAIVTAGREPGQGWTEAVLAAIDERVGIVAVPNVHWTDGALLDLAAIGARAREVGARLVVDASQSLGAMPLDVAAVRPDFVVTVGYKWLLGPMAMGYLWVADAWLEGEPLEENWISRQGSEDFAGLAGDGARYRPGARRYDAGQNVALETTAIASATLEMLVGWGAEAIAARLREITDGVAGAVAAAGLSLTVPPEQRCPHMLGVALPPERLARAAATLAAAGVHASVRGTALRLSPHVYTDAQDIERLADALRRL